jgi:hypothetical protein
MNNLLDTIILVCGLLAAGAVAAMCLVCLVVWLGGEQPVLWK